MAIRDIKQFQELKELFETVETLGSLAEHLYTNGFLRSAAHNSIQSNLSNNLLPAQKAFNELRDLPDQFNTRFAPYGWIASEDMSVDAMREALSIDQIAGIDKAEEFLTEYWNGVLAFWIRRFWSLPYVKHRRPLVDLAFVDHTEKRFHASIPVILTQIDGISLDLTRKSFFESGSKKTRHLQSADTIAGDPSGLAKIAELLNSPRGTTTVDGDTQIYRNGILHGRDIGYHSHVTSTKAFALFVSLRPWVAAVVARPDFVPPKLPLPGISEQLEPASRYGTIGEMIKGLGDYNGSSGMATAIDRGTYAEVDVEVYVWPGEVPMMIEELVKRSVLFMLYHGFIHTDCQSMKVNAWAAVREMNNDDMQIVVGSRHTVMATRPAVQTTARQVFKVDDLALLVGERAGNDFYPNGWAPRFGMGYYNGLDYQPGLDKHYETLLQNCK